tara:strand:+ start:241 stop:666 length:426 start_codon:yes stop_codon:yes gene_type:complete
MKHHTKTLGDLGVLKAKLDLFEKGYITCSPDTEHSPFDLVAVREEQCLRVQVKARNIDKVGTCTVHFRSSWADKNGTHMKRVDKSLIDLYCVYCVSTDKCYYFDPSKYKSSITLRMTEAKGTQKTNKNINWHEDYLGIPKL